MLQLGELNEKFVMQLTHYWSFHDVTFKDSHIGVFTVYRIRGAIIQLTEKRLQEKPFTSFGTNGDLQTIPAGIAEKDKCLRHYEFISFYIIDWQLHSIIIKTKANIIVN